MPDLLVKLYNLPEIPSAGALEAQGIRVKRAIAPEKHAVVEWVRETFGNGWASECDAAFSNHPVSCYIATKDKRTIGFGCYEATCKNFFGPTGVEPEYRGKGIGTHLLLHCLHAMREMGYGYAIIGSAGPVDFYAKLAGAQVIEDSNPGIYRDMVNC